MDPATLPLRDIHLPEAVPLFPPAPGWWLLLGLVLAALAGAILYWRRWSRQRPIRQVLRSLNQAELLARRGELAPAAQVMSTALRRCAITLDSEGVAAGLIGERWLQWLDGRWERSGFTAPSGSLLLSAPYRRRATGEEVMALIALSRSWVKSQRVGG